AFTKLHTGGKGFDAFTDDERAAYDAHVAEQAEAAPSRAPSGDGAGHLDNAALALVVQAHHLPQTDAGNAEFFAFMFRDDLRYDHGGNRWLIWDAHRWRPDRDGTVYRMALESVRFRKRSSSQGLSDTDEKKLWNHAHRSEGRAKLDALISLARNLPP